MNRIQILAQALRLAITASNAKQLNKAVKLAESIAAGMTKREIETAKRAALGR